MMVDPNIALSSCICFIYFCRFCAKTISDLNYILLMPKLATGVMMSTCLQGLCRLACCKPGLGKCITVVWFICNGYRSLMSRFTIYHIWKQYTSFINQSQSKWIYWCLIYSTQISSSSVCDYWKDRGETTIITIFWFDSRKKLPTK